MGAGAQPGAIRCGKAAGNAAAFDGGLMDGTIVLLGLAAVAALLLGPAAFFLTLNARRRIALLEAQRDGALTRIRKLETAVLLAFEAAQRAAPATPAETPVPAPLAPPPTAPTMESVEATEVPGPWGAPVKDNLPETPQLPPVVQAALRAGEDARDTAASPTPAPTAAELDGAAPDETPSVFAQDNEAAKAPPRAARIQAGGGLEEALGTRWAVWVGGVALAFGALLLVRYTIEQGFFGPGMRIFTGAVLAAVLIAAGEFLRRQASGGAGEKNAVSIPAALTAAGTVAAFGTIYAAHALYGFIGSGAALVLLGATGVAAMFAAALHGPALAGLGLAGAFATPLLVETHAPTAWPVVIYLAVVAAAAYALARKRNWTWLALTAAAGGALWGAALIPGYETAAQPEFFIARIAHILLQSALAGWFLGHAPQAGARDADIRVARAGSAALAVLALLGVGALVRAVESGQHIPVFAGAAAALTLAPLVIAYLAPAVATAAIGAALTVLAGIVLWPMTLDVDAANGFFQHQPPIRPAAFQLFALCASAAVTGVCALRLWRGVTLPTIAAASYAAAAAVTPPAALTLAYFALTPTRENIWAAAAALALAVLFALLAYAFAARHRATQGPAAKLTLGAFATAAVAGVSLALIFATREGTLTIALALTALGAAAVAVRLDLAAMRQCVTVLGLLICARFAAEPRIVGADIANAPLIFNWLLFGYGVPAASFALAGWLLRKRLEDTASRVADGLAVLFAALLFFTQVRHALNAGASSLTEQSLFALSSLAFSIVLVRLDAARANIVFRYASYAAGAVGLALAAGALLLRFNPLFTDEALQGRSLFNTLILAYFAPAVLAALLASFARLVRPNWYWGGALALACALIFFFGALEIRVLFHGLSIGARRGLDLMEAGADICVCLVLANAAAYAGAKAARADNRLGLAAAGFLALGAALAVPGLGLLANPLLRPQEIAGGAVFNSLLLAFLLPALLAAVLAYWGRFIKPALLRPAATVAAVFMLFAYASLEVRRLFQGPDIRLWSGFMQDEWFTYSAVWLVLGVVLLAIGVWRASREARLGSAVLVVASVVKIFVFDLAGLEGFLRAMSFIGLGAVLMAVGLVYQRFIFNKADAKPA